VQLYALSQFITYPAKALTGGRGQPRDSLTELTNLFISTKPPHRRLSYLLPHPATREPRNARMSLGVGIHFPVAKPGAPRTVVTTVRLINDRQCGHPSRASPDCINEDPIRHDTVHRKHQPLFNRLLSHSIVPMTTQNTNAKHEVGNIPAAPDGSFKRPASTFRDVIERGGRFEPERGARRSTTLGCRY
jgi:hypothetical protein